MACLFSFKVPSFNWRIYFPYTLCARKAHDYIQAEKLLREMLQKGSITEVEFNKIDALNR
ncbi:SHOCT domain-containing protein [Caldifermentibacillus hisashii]|uniref:SHOCT domain-containing protein n=1 Tax=Caldifermentibacillus hisashii TaxID=996558 RepID=UPI003D25C131